MGKREERLLELEEQNTVNFNLCGFSLYQIFSKQAIV